MSNKKNSLSHHEKLRLDYLYKNIHYLNESERHELGYLWEKKRLCEETEQVSSLSESRTFVEEEPSPVLVNEPTRKRRRRLETSSKDISIYKKTVKTKKAKKGTFKSIFLFFVFCFFLMVAVMGYRFVKGLNSVADKPRTEVFNGVPTSNGTNILILGTDSRRGDNSGETRTDTMMVLNIGNKDHKIKLVSFMRDTLVTIGDYEYKLNAAYPIGEQNYQHGADAVREVLKDNFDIDIQYYVMVDFATFATTIDTLFPEGVRIDAQFATIEGESVQSVEVPNDLQLEENAPAYQTIQVGHQQMDGKTLLNYARYRSDDEGDFGRTKRQQQVLSAVLSQARNPMKLFSGAEALGKIVAMTPTTVPTSFMWLHAPGVLMDATKGIERTTIPEYGDWVDVYDSYGGQALQIDFEKYKERLAELGLR